MDKRKVVKVDTPDELLAKMARKKNAECSLKIGN
jgi:hypothetical protein